MNSLNVVGLKLTNGLELVAKVVGEDEKDFHLEDAFFLQTVQQQDGSINVEYAPLTILGEPTGKSHVGFDLKLPKHSVLFPFNLNVGIVERYLKYTSPIDLSMAPSVK